jgi:hypothetical protein
MKMKTTTIPGRAGGLAVRTKEAPLHCPREGCAKTFDFCTPWHSYLGHLGLHGLADNYFDGDLEAAQRHLRKNGLAPQDPAPWNGAWPKYKPITQQ